MRPFFFTIERVEQSETATASIQLRRPRSVTLSVIRDCASSFRARSCLFRRVLRWYTRVCTRARVNLALWGPCATSTGARTQPMLIVV